MKFAIMLAVVGFAAAQMQLTAQAPTVPAASELPACQPSLADVRAVALKQASQHVDGNALIQVIDKAASVETRHFISDGWIKLVGNDDYSISMIPPYGVYRNAVLEAYRRGQDITPIRGDGNVRIRVSASTISSPDIAKISIERDGRGVPPRNSTLRALTKSTALGVDGSLRPLLHVDDHVS